MDSCYSGTMARVTAAEAADKWVRRTSAAAPDYKAGVQKVSTAPGILAQKQSAVAAQNYQEAISSGRWGQRVASVSLSDWQNAAVNKGAARLSQGVQAASDKMQNFMATFLPFEDQVVQRVKQQYPRGSTDQNIARAEAIMRALAEFKNRK